MKGFDLLDETFLQHIRDKKSSILNNINPLNLDRLVSYLTSRHILNQSDIFSVLSQTTTLEQAETFFDKVLESRSKSTFQEVMYVMELTGLGSEAAQLDSDNN